MRKRILTVLVGLTLVLTLIFGLVPACGGGETTGPGTGGPALPGGTAQGEVIRWRWQSNSVAGTATYWIAQEFADNVELASGGRLILELQPQAAIVGTLEIFDAVATGAIEFGDCGEYYFLGKNPVFMLTGMIAAHFTWDEMMVWFYADSTGGMKVTEDRFAKFGIKYILSACSITEQHLSSKKRVTEAKDYKGLTIRGVGWTGMVLQEPEFGASGIMMPTTDIYTALQTGLIEATELGNPFSNFTMGMHEVTKYAVFPGVHQLTQTQSKLVNMDKWNSLSKDLQFIIQLVCLRNNVRQATFNMLESAKIVRELPTKYGIEIVTLSLDCQRTWARVSWRLSDQMAAKNPEWKKTADDMKAMLNVLRPYLKFQQPDFGTEGLQAK